MIRSSLLVALLAAVVALPTDRTATAQQPKSRKVAFLVGVGKFQHDLPNLKGSPQKDVDSLDAELRKNGFEVVKLTDEKATKKDVESRFRKLLDGDGDTAKALGQGDVLLVALCSHGFTFTSAMA
jgi:hypothetical protein